MIRILVVDDEEPARMHLKRLLKAEQQGMEVVGEAANGLEALETIEQVKPEVVFLDIEMPGMTGFEVVRNLVHRPLVVFATAYDEFAIQAFETNALDYLLKPVQPARLRQTLTRVQENLQKDRSDYQDAMQEVLLAMERGRSNPVTKLAVHRSKRIILLRLPEILHITIEDKLVFVHTEKDRFLIEKTITELEAMLDQTGFRRINRGTLVNMDHVRELTPWFSGTYRAKLTNGAELDVSRERARHLMEDMGV